MINDSFDLDHIIVDREKMKADFIYLRGLCDRAKELGIIEQTFLYRLFSVYFKWVVKRKSKSWIK